jgi:nicotinamide mononucleotide transporter
MNGGIEVGANLFNVASVLLAGRNNVHTWWTGIIGCFLFGWVFFLVRLYADVTLQLFFIVTSLVGWWQWRTGRPGGELPVSRIRWPLLLGWGMTGLLTTAGYGWLLHHFTDAYAPFVDSAILAFSIVGQLLLMQRRYESWWCWLLVNSLSVPLYLARGLLLTALLYALFWANAAWALVSWRRLLPGR